MKIVQFENGKYGVRTFWFLGWWFLDLTSVTFKWRQCDAWFHCCLTDDLEKVKQQIGQSKMKYKIYRD